MRLTPATYPTRAETGRLARWRTHVDALASAHPELPLAGPLLLYIALLGLVSIVPPTWQPEAVALRGVASLAAVWTFRRHLPPWGRPYWLIAILGGAFAAWGWVVVQHFFNNFGLGGRLPLMPGSSEVVDPRQQLGAGTLFWWTWWLRMLVAITAVPVVEEIFWRGFLLRALINWNDFERVPLGKFTWFSFLGTSLISTLQHPANWGVSILCWMAFNVVFYWTRSLFCLVLLHACTNLVLYLILLRVGDWSNW